MPPWDAFPWFDTPVETSFTLIGAAPYIQIAGLSVRRVCILIASGDGGTIQVSTQRGGANTGWTLSSGTGPMILTQQSHGVLCQVPWFAKAVAGLAVTVVEVFLRAWPGGDPVG